MDAVTLTVFGAEDLAKQLDEIEHLIHKLRLKLGDLNERRLRLEMQLNRSSSCPMVDSEKSEMTIECKCIGLDEALEKVTKLMGLLKQVDQYKELVALSHSSNFCMNTELLAQTICDKDREFQE